MASAATVAIGGNSSDNITISGTTTITAFDTVAAGIRRFVTFSGSLTLTYNATSLILPGAANITTAANDTAEFMSLGSGNWICIRYQKASGLAVVSSGGGAMTKISTLTASSSASLAWTGLSGYDRYELWLSQLLPASNGWVLITLGYGAGPTYYSSGYTYEIVYALGSSSAGGVSTASAWNCTNSSTSASGRGMSAVYCLDGCLGTANVQISGQTFSENTAGTTYEVNSIGGVVTTGAAITAIKIAYSSGNIATGNATLYGVN